MFVASTAILCTGLLIRIWLNAVRMQHLEQLTVREIELTRPHVPSLGVLVAIFACSASLLAASLQTVGGLPPFNQPYEWLYLGALFTLSGTAGILAELHYKTARDYPFAFAVGTAAAFLFLAYKFSLVQGSAAVTAFFATLLLSSLIAIRQWLFRVWPERVQSFSVATFIMWLLLYIRA